MVLVSNNTLEWQHLVAVYPLSNEQPLNLTITNTTMIHVYCYLYRGCSYLLYQMFVHPVIVHPLSSVTVYEVAIACELVTNTI